jgi:hypothetical protein
MSCFFPGVLLTGYHHVLLSGVAVIPDPLGHTSSLDNIVVLPLLNILLSLFLTSRCPVLTHRGFSLRVHLVLRLLGVVPGLGMSLLDHLREFVTVPEDFVVSVPPASLFLIFHPPPQVGLQAFWLTHPLLYLISPVDRRSHNQIFIYIGTT